jgi:pyruvate/2-oxoglutarate dehydrogenase complex dihydrolipoamide acyltransferase (E2) component
VKRLRGLKVMASAVLMISILIAAEASQAIGEGFLIAEENRMTHEVNLHRQAHGAPPLRQDPSLQMVARRQAQRMASAGYIYHNPNLAGEAGGAVPNWLRVGENVGVGPSVPSVQEAFLASPPHHANIDKEYNMIGLGAVPGSSGRLFFTQNFALTGGAPAAARAVAPPAPPPPPRRAVAPRGRAPRRARVRRPSRARRRARVRGVELVQPSPQSTGGRSGVSFACVITGLLSRFGVKVTFWD